MALKQMEPTKEKVGGYNFYIKPFAAFKAANLTGELSSVLAPLLGALAPLVSDQKEGSLMDIDAAQAAEALSNCTNISGDKMEKLMQKLLLGGHIVVELPDEEGETKAERLDMDIANEIFCGEVQDMFILCFHVIKLNFNGFFKRVAGLSGKVGSASPKTPRKVI